MQHDRLMLNESSKKSGCCGGGGGATTSLYCAAIVIAVMLAQVGLMVALLYAESTSTSASNGAAVSSSGGGTVYCTVTSNDPSAVSAQVNSALQSGCTLVAGLGVGIGAGGGFPDNPNARQMDKVIQYAYGQALLCPKGKGCSTHS
jgi:hypothetical protein